jgi:hypothetical protein
MEWDGYTIVLLTAADAFQAVSIPGKCEMIRPFPYPRCNDRRGGRKVWLGASLVVLTGLFCHDTGADLLHPHPSITPRASQLTVWATPRAASQHTGRLMGHRWAASGLSPWVGTDGVCG